MAFKGPESYILKPSMQRILEQIIKDTKNYERNKHPKFSYVAFDVLKLPEDIVNNILSSLHYLDCFELIKINRQWKQAMENPHNWPTQLYHQGWISSNFQWNMLKKKMHDLRVPTTVLQWDYSVDMNTNINEVEKFNFVKYMPLESIKIEQQTITSKTLGIICKRKSLKTLDLINCQSPNQRNINLNWLKQCTKLTHLNLKDTRLDGSELKPLIGHCQLATLILSGTRITDDSMEIICQFPLTSLDISWTNIHDISLPLIKSKNIPNLNLYGCWFTLAGFKKTWYELDDLDTLARQSHDESKEKEEKKEKKREKKGKSSFNPDYHLRTCIANMWGIMQTRIIDGVRDTYGIYDSLGVSRMESRYFDFDGDAVTFQNLDHLNPVQSIWRFHEEQNRAVTEAVLNDLTTQLPAEFDGDANVFQNLDEIDLDEAIWQFHEAQN